MFELPIFPLNTVLFPGMPLSLHIFEDRYKLMIGKCLQERRAFGVVLIRQGAEALGPLAEPNKIGCTAFISQVERLHQGRMNIGVIGQRRFRIISLDTELSIFRSPKASRRARKFWPIDSGPGLFATSTTCHG